ncbi:hypothetical protein KBC03_06670 [Patescibacteria group bacterium]|nr:hypothetical protein [Patescibacteria group bacterium]
MEEKLHNECDDPFTRERIVKMLQTTSKKITADNILELLQVCQSKMTKESCALLKEEIKGYYNNRIIRTFIIMIPCLVVAISLPFIAFALGYNYGDKELLVGIAVECILLLALFVPPIIMFLYATKKISFLRAIQAFETERYT